MRESPRIRRLRTDARAMETLRDESSILDFTCPDSSRNGPPGSYLIRFHGKGLWRNEQTNEVLVTRNHEVSIQLGASYPRMMPELQWRTPIFHPNISASGIVCLGGYGTHWVPSLNLDELCAMLWDMVRYQNYDIESPYNRDAALWARLHEGYQFPLDLRPIRDKLAAHQSQSRAEADAVRDASIPVALPLDHTSTNPVGAPGTPAPAISAVSQDDEVIFLGEEIVELEAVEPEDPDIMFID